MLHAKFKIGGLLVQKKMILKVFTLYGRVCYLGNVTFTICINFVPLLRVAPHEIWLRLAKRFQRRLNIIEGRRRTYAGELLYHAHQ